MSLLVETIKVDDGRMLNLRFHNERMMKSIYSIYGVRKKIDLGTIIEIPDYTAGTIFRCRVIYDRSITDIQFTPYTFRIVKSLKMIEDNSICYPYKYVDREKFERLMERREDCDDILIVKNKMITDTSYSNVILRDFNGDWYTPSTYLLPGTRRASLLTDGLVREAKIGQSDLKKYSELKLVNSMIGMDDSEAIQLRYII